MATGDTVTVELPRHLIGSTVTALKRAASSLESAYKDTSLRASERAIAGAEAKWLRAAAQVLTEAARGK
jgi:hypothetical protein